MKHLVSFLFLLLASLSYSQISEIELKPDGVIYPRMTTAQRNAISSPVEGQCIYNTSTNNVNCFNGSSWQAPSQGNSSEISDNDGDTSVDVEAGTDNDLIIFTTGGKQVMRHDGQTLEILNSGQSVFIGENAGQSDDNTNNQNTFIGYRAGEDITTGTQNVAIGNQALRDNIIGSTNIAIGKEALAKSTGSNNIAIGFNAGRDITNQTTKNVFMGSFAGFAHSEGESNIMIGSEAGRNLQDGSENIFIGNEAGFTANSDPSAYFGTSRNTFLGSNAGRLLKHGRSNILLGSFAGSGLQEGNSNVSIGGILPRFAEDNVLVGVGAAEDWPSGFFGNTMVGPAAGNSNSFNFDSGRFNTFIGANTGNDQNGSFGVVLGAYRAPFRGFNTGGSNNVVIGNNATANFEGTEYNNTLIIESDTLWSPGTASLPLIYGEFDNDIVKINGEFTVSNFVVGNTDLRINSLGTLALASSDVRLKHDIKPITNALEKVNKLQGVSFMWNEASEVGTQLGMIAQEVQKVIPEVVNENKDGFLSVDYTETIGLLVEAIKELSDQNDQLQEKQLELEKQLLIQSTQNN